MLIFMHYKSVTTRVLAIFPLIFIQLSTSKFFLNFLLVGFFGFEYLSRNYYLGIIPLLYFNRDGNYFNFILFLIATCYKSTNDEYIITIPILLSGIGFTWNPSGGYDFVLCLLLVFWLAKFDGFFLLLLFPIFEISMERKPNQCYSLTSLIIIPFFGWVEYFDCLVILPIPSVIYFKFFSVYSVIVCYRESNNNKFFSVLLILFISTDDGKNNRSIWLFAPLFLYQEKENGTFIMFLPILLLFWKSKDQESFYVSLMYLLIGYASNKNIKTIWFIPFFVYYSTKTTTALYLLLFHFQSKVEKLKNEDQVEKQIIHYRCWLFPIYFVMTSRLEGEMKSIFIWIFPIFIYKSPGGFLKNLIHGSFSIGKYTIKNHFLFLSFKISSLDFELHLILFGLMGYSKRVTADKSLDNLKSQSLNDEITTNHWCLLFVFRCHTKYSGIEKSIHLIPLISFTYILENRNFTGYEMTILLFLVNIKTGKTKEFIIFGLISYVENTFLKETCILIFFFHGYSLIKYQLTRTDQLHGIHITKNIFYIYFLINYEYDEANLFKYKKNQRTHQKLESLEHQYEKYPAKLLISLGWIWPHYGLFNLVNNYVDHSIIISIFLLFRYQQDENYLSTWSNGERRKYKQICFFWIFHSYLSLIRTEISYQGRKYDFIFCLAVLLYYRFEETVRNPEHQSDRIYTLYSMAVIFHPKTSLIAFKRENSEFQKRLVVNFLPFFGFSEKKMITNKKYEEESESDSFLQHGDTFDSTVNIWMTFLFRYKFESLKTSLAMFPWIPFDSSLTFWLALIRFIKTKNSTEGRLLYRLVLYQNNDNGKNINLELNPLFNHEKNENYSESNILGGVFGLNSRKGCKLCCCIFCCSNSNRID
eukprot:gene7087-11250_t